MALSTGNITLQEVVNEVGTSPDGNGKYTLLRSFLDAHTYGFNPTYSGSRNSLYNFKGYDHSISEIVLISPLSYNAPSALAGSFTITVTSNSSWSVNATDLSWIGFSQTSGTFDDTFIVYYNANPGSSAPERSTRIIVTGEDGTGKFCLLTQPGGTQ